MPWPNKRLFSEQPFVHSKDLSIADSNINAFRRRQQEDLKRYDRGATTSLRHRPQHEKNNPKGHRDHEVTSNSAESNDGGNGGWGWRDSEGDGLDDFGVDEYAEFYDEDDIPLAELLRRRHVHDTLRKQ